MEPGDQVFICKALPVLPTLGKWPPAQYGRGHFLLAAAYKLVCMGGNGRMQY